MVGIGLSEIKQKQDENVGECWRRSEKVGVNWMFKWYVTTTQLITSTILLIIQLAFALFVFHSQLVLGS